MEHLDISKKDFIVAAAAAKAVGYTSDYITKLAREEKIDGHKNGRQWFVSLSSVEKFVEKSKQEKLTRNSQLRIERKQEQNQKQIVQTENLPAWQTSRDGSQVASGRFVAFAQTCAIAILGLSIGVATHLVPAHNQLGNMNQVAQANNANQSFFSFLAERLYNFITHNSKITDAEQAEDVTEPAISESAQDVSGVQTSDSYGLVVLSDDDIEAERERVVQNAFSDEVEVAFDIENPEEGVVTPNFKSGPGDPYDFLLLLNKKISSEEEVSVTDIEQSSGG